MTKLIFIRHGQSQWNRLNLFTGWVDVPLSPDGIKESFDAGDLIQDERIDIIYTSTLIRAQMTAMLVMTKNHSKKTPVILHPKDKKLAHWETIYSETTKNEIIPVICDWRLNERMYGKLQGLNKKELAAQYGEAQVQIWRRSYDIPPPEGESLKMTRARALRFFEQTIMPKLQAQQNVLVVAHGNSLRSLMMKLDGLTSEEVVKLELATGVPVIYEFKNNTFTKQTTL